MATKVFLTDFAKKELHKIFKYYKENASPNVSKNIVEGIVEKGKSLDFQTKIGQKKPLLLATENKTSAICF